MHSTGISLDRDLGGSQRALRSAIVDIDSSPVTQEAAMNVSRTSTRKVANKRAAPKSAASRSRRGIVISAEQRRRLIEDAAYFRAERYRCVEPGNYREEDRCRAEIEIETVIRRNTK